MDKDQNKQGWTLALLILVGVVARLEMASLGHNYDFQSYQIVVGILNQGGNVYAGTTRYNYGPVWFHILHLLDFLAGHKEMLFRYFIAGFLCVVDTVIGVILWRRYGLLAAGLFLLNPVSIIISGFHGQFDNFAILLGLLSVIMIGDEFEKPVGGRKFVGLLLLGLSLMTKHVLFAFPCWLAVKQKGLFQKCLMVLVPVAVFLAGFVPYWHDGSQGIIQNVFHYRSVANQYFYNFFVPACFNQWLSGYAVWFICLGVFGFIYRSKNAVESLFFYAAVMTATSPAIVNQYLAIPIVFIATRMNAVTVIYTILATEVLLVHRDGLHILGVLPYLSPNIPIYILALSVAWATWQSEITMAVRFLYNWLKVELESQFEVKK